MDTNQTRVCRLHRSRLIGIMLAATAALTSAGCGLPGQGSAHRVDDGDVPYRLLDPDAKLPDSPARAGAPGPVPVVFWIVDDKLVPATAEGFCSERPEALVARLLDALSAGPGDAARASGRSTALPPDSGLELIGILDGRAEVKVESQVSLSAERLPMAVGQLVLTVLSAPGIRSVELVSDDGPIEAPLPGGVLTEGPVTVDDYVGLVVSGYEALGKWGCFTVTADDSSGRPLADDS